MKFKVGDRVKVIAVLKGHGFSIGETVTITDEFTDGDPKNDHYECSNGSKEWYLNDDELEAIQTINTSNKMTTNQLMKDALRAQVDKLLKANNTVTTLELKVELRKTDPEFYWNQATVSQMMDELAQNGTLVYTDNGTYRIYSFNPTNSTFQTAVGITTGTNGSQVAYNSPAPQVQTISTKATKNLSVGTKKISRTKALDLIQNSKGHFFKVVFTKKKDGTERTLNCQYTKDLGVSPLGLVRVKEASLLKQFKKEGTLANIPSKSVIRSFNINNLKQLGIGGQTYKITN